MNFFFFANYIIVLTDSLYSNCYNAAKANKKKHAHRSIKMFQFTIFVEVPHSKVQTTGKSRKVYRYRAAATVHGFNV